MQDKIYGCRGQVVWASGLAVVLCGLLVGEGRTQERGDRLNTLIERRAWADHLQR